MSAPKAFAVGGKVQVTNRGNGVVTYGPITGPNGGDHVVVKLASGDEASFNTLNVWPFPPAAKPFAVGDKVEHSAFGRGEIVFGPFRLSGVYNNHTFLVRGGWGDELKHVTAEFLTLLESAQPTTFEYAGITYELAATYRDCDGDLWEFTGEQSSDGTPEVHCVAGGYSKLSEAVAAYGPLNKETS